MKKILQSATPAVISVGMGAGVVSAAQSSTVSVGADGGTGANSTVNVDSKNKDTRKVNNKTKLNLVNGNVQAAASGNARTTDNRTGGNATTGAAENSNGLVVDGTVNNSAANAAAQAGAGNGTNGVTVGSTGRDSTVNVDAKNKTSVKVDNKTKLNIANANEQGSVSGNARVSDNNTGGAAQSGDVKNTSTTSVTFNVVN
jgi:hypothetical protein